jgi:hypothetical protein
MATLAERESTSILDELSILQVKLPPWSAIAIAILILLAIVVATPFVQMGIGELRTERRLRDLRVRAESGEPGERVAALAELAALRDPPSEVIADLAELAVGEAPPEVRQQALAGLQAAARNQELPTAIWETLIAELDEDPGPAVLGALLAALGSTDGSITTLLPRQARLIELAVGPGDITVRSSALGLLAGFAWQGRLSAEGEAGLAQVLEQRFPAGSDVGAGGGGDAGLALQAAAALGGAAEHRPLSAGSRTALYRTATGGRPADREMAIDSLERDRRRNAPGGFEQAEIEALLAARSAEREEAARAALERQREAALTSEPTRAERFFGRERVGGNLYFAAIWISGIVCVVWLVVYLARVVAFAGARSWRAVRGLLAIGLWVPISIGTGYLFFLGLFLFGHNSTPPLSRQLQLAAAAFVLAALYGAVGWGLSRLVRR